MSEGGDTLPLKHVAQRKMPHIDTAMGSTFIHINHFLIMIFTSTDATRLSVSLGAVPNKRTVHPTSPPPKLGASVPLMPLAEAWFMLVGVVTTLGLTVKQPGGALSKSGAHQSVGGESKFDAPQSVSAPRVKRAQAKREGSPPPVRRRITSTTFLRFMNLTSDMVRHLVLAPDKLSLACVVHADRNRRPAEAAAGEQTKPPHHRPTFRCELRLRDGARRVWPVSYEATESSNQYHRRLVQGWREFCKHHGVRVGDAIDFVRCSPGGEADLDVRIIRRR